MESIPVAKTEIKWKMTSKNGGGGRENGIPGGNGCPAWTRTMNTQIQNLVCYQLHHGAVETEEVISTG